jgi:periplasmic divalent cation tolerance protein
MKIILVYVTTSSEREAVAIVQDLIEKRLIACGNIFPPFQSIYRWEGKIETSAEVGMLLKSRASLFPKIEEAIRALHSYECPCILSLPVEAAHLPFHEWVCKQTGAP